MFNMLTTPWAKLFKLNPFCLSFFIFASSIISSLTFSAFHFNVYSHKPPFLVRCQSFWPDLNRRPLPYHGSALPTELQKLRYTEGGTRTHTMLPLLDFESNASTNFTTPASINSQLNLIFFLLIFKFIVFYHTIFLNIPVVSFF
jgi:hypothetical protein